jgi:hypothetical protein
MQAHLAALFPDQSDHAQDNSEPGQPSTNLLSLERKLPQTEAEQGPACEEQGQDWISRLGREKNSSYQRIVDVWVSTSDPDATVMYKKGGGGSHPFCS